MPTPVPSRVVVLTAVFFGGALGTGGRAALLELLPASPAGWPWATLLANVVAAGALGGVVAWRRTSHAGWWRPFLATGLCGGLSTFSTLQLELWQMVDAGEYALASTYAAVSVALGVVAVVAGTRVVARRAW